MRLKPGVSLKGVQPEMVVGLLISETIFAAHGIELVVTSVTDGVHGVNSLHKKGLAADYRSKTLPKEWIPKVAEALRDALTNEFDVVVEVDHFHIEYDPER